MEAEKEDKLAKNRMKKYKDASRPVRDHDIEVVNLVISKRKAIKHDLIYDSKPYKVVAIYGTQVKGMREDRKYKTRDSQKWKWVQVQARRSYGEVERPSRYLDETDIGAGNQGGKGWGRAVQGQDIVEVMNKAGGKGRQGMYEAGGADVPGAPRSPEEDAPGD